ncbi:hypothetical protein HOH87_05650 [bacterium]|jgi:phosphoribosylformylglycinamidine (FGAM) synthase PurS component|nr:hypothetical protein [bacterium]
MSQITVWISQKNTDLTCLSAKEALVNLKGLSQLKSLRRTIQWDITTDLSEEAATALVTQILNDSYYIANPNKESHRFSSPFTSGSDSVQFQVTANDYTGEHRLIDQIEAKFNSKINQLSKSTIWDIQLDASEEESNTLLKTVALPFLANPISETAQRVSQKAATTAL